MRLSGGSRLASTARYWESESERAERLLREAEYALEQAKKRVKHCQKQVKLAKAENE